MAYRFPFSPYPIGWFRALGSDALRPGRLLGLKLFGRDLVAFRASSGKVSILDSHCPHLGAPLHLGKVVGESVECRFHGWRYDGTGACVHAPLFDKIPPRAKARAWPVVEQDGAIMVWHHPRGAAPSWPFPRIPELTDPSWYTAAGPAWPRIRTHVQEFAENGMDLAHFVHLHRQQTLSAESFGVETDGPTLIHRTYQRYNLFALAKLWIDEVGGPLDIHALGLGCAVERTTVHAKIELRYTYAFYFTPIDEEHVVVTSTLAIGRLPSGLATRLLWLKAFREGRATIDQDVPIWEGKSYQSHPALGALDGPVAAYRRWTRQFYEDDVPRAASETHEAS